MTITVSTITVSPLERGRTWAEALAFAATTPSDNSQHVQTLYDLARAIRPALAVEIGVGFGWFTTAILAALEGTDGKLLSVDRVEYPETRRALACDWWEYIIEDSERFARSWQGEIDLLVFDHSHIHPSHTTYPLGLLAPSISESGAVVVHGTASHPELGAALRAWAAGAWAIEEHADNGGLAILRRRT
jgi:predicted O-methyltransferase YrrM